MAAVIQSAITAKPTINGASRNDLRAGDLVTLAAFDLSHTTYSWTLADTPETKEGTPSSAVLSTTTGTGPITFTVDNEGSYLIRLIVDAGLGTEDTQFVCLRYLTVFGDLQLAAAGERRDETGSIPVDAAPEGWARNQNINLLRILAYVQRVSTSGRTITVDANRGLDHLNPVDDPTIAEGFADYSTISAAISAALSMSPAPSLNDPVVIQVFPGYYVENVDFFSHVHVVGVSNHATDSRDRSVVIRTASVSPMHSAHVTGAGQFCLLSNLTLENVGATSDPVLSKIGSGTLYLHRCTILQNGNDPAQGPAYSHDGGWVIGNGCTVQSNVTADGQRLALRQNTTSTDMLWIDSDFTGPSAIAIGASNLPLMNAEFRGCRMDSTFVSSSSWAVQSNAELLVLDRCDVNISGGLSTKAVDIHPDAGVHGSNLVVDVRWCHVVGDINFNTTGVVGDTRLRLGASDYSAVNITGALTEQTATVEGTSLFYDNSVTGITPENVQDALDHIFAVISSTGIGSYVLTLSTAYNGMDPLTALSGAGDGRRILADSGAVIIQAANPPLSSPLLGQTDGWLQVEGNVQIGGINAPELDLDPNSYGVGPQILGGSLVYPDIAATPHRAIPAFIIRANATGSALNHSYNLLLESKTASDASRGEIGRLLLRGGDSLSGGSGAPPDAGSIYLQGGCGHAATGDPGNVWLSPGRNLLLGTTGKVWFTNPTSGSSATLDASSAFVGGVSGDITFYVSGVGLVTASILNVDLLATVQTKLNALSGLSCAVDAANDPIQITTLAAGKNAEVYFTEDNQGGALNTALGNFSIGGGSTFVPGGWAEEVSIGATGASELTIFGDLIVTGSFSAGGSGAFFLNRKTITVADSPYTVLNTDHYLGVNTTGGAVVINLPTTLPGSGDGRELYIKDEGGNAAANTITVQIAGGALIDDGSDLVLSADWAGVTMVANGLTGASTRWYVV